MLCAEEYGGVMDCPSCERRAIAVTLETIVGTVSVCKTCGIQGGHPAFLEAVRETLEMERYWKYLDSDALARAERGY